MRARCLHTQILLPATDTAAQLLITAGLNPHRLRSEAAFAALCGVAPVPASSGKTTRHRLSRGGDRAANNALFRIALVRMSSHQPTKDYVQRQEAKGHTRVEILRKLERAIAREIFKLFTRQIAVPEYADLCPARQAKTSPHRRGQPPRRLAHRHRTHRTQTATPRRPGRRVQIPAQSSLTPNT